MDEDIRTLEQLFQNAGQAHHEAYIETDGYDPEWPQWYASYLDDKLPGVLKAKFTRSELIWLMVELDHRQKSEAPGGKWALFWAKELAQMYL